MGIDASRVEVTQIDKQGIWVLIGEKESFLSFENFPWFRNAPVSAIHNVELLNPRHLHWPDLDVDLAVELIGHPERFPPYRGKARIGDQEMAADPDRPEQLVDSILC